MAISFNGNSFYFAKFSITIFIRLWSPEYNFIFALQWHDWVKWAQTSMLLHKKLVIHKPCQVVWFHWKNCYRCNRYNNVIDINTKQPPVCLLSFLPSIKLNCISPVPIMVLLAYLWMFFIVKPHTAILKFSFFSYHTISFPNHVGVLRYVDVRWVYSGVCDFGYTISAQNIARNFTSGYSLSVLYHTLPYYFCFMLLLSCKMYKVAQ